MPGLWSASMLHAWLATIAIGISFLSSARYSGVSLRLPLPAGRAYDRAGAITLNPDEEVQARLLLVFAKFRELQSARGVMRFLRTSGLPLPVRPILGPSPHDVIWREADSARVRNILQNPAYAGAYVYGRRQKNPSRCRSGSARGTIKVAVGDWAVCLQAAHALDDHLVPVIDGELTGHNRRAAAM